MIWLVLDGPDMVLEGHPRIVPRTLCLYCRTLAHVMERNGSSSDSQPSQIGSHIIRTFDDEYMGLV
jgi:hypothetical protein